MARVITQTQWSRQTEVLYICNSGKPGVSPALSEFSRVILWGSYLNKKKKKKKRTSCTPSSLDVPNGNKAGTVCTAGCARCFWMKAFFSYICIFFNIITVHLNKYLNSIDSRLKYCCCITKKKKKQMITNQTVGQSTVVLDVSRQWRLTVCAGDARHQAPWLAARMGRSTALKATRLLVSLIVSHVHTHTLTQLALHFCGTVE